MGRYSDQIESRLSPNMGRSRLVNEISWELTSVLQIIQKNTCYLCICDIRLYAHIDTSVFLHIILYAHCRSMSVNKVLTLAFVRRHGEILLGYKKRGFGVGKWNGFGGKVETGETIEDAAKRFCEKFSNVKLLFLFC